MAKFKIEPFRALGGRVPDIGKHISRFLRPLKYDVYEIAKKFAVESLTRTIEMKSSAFDVVIIKDFFPRMRYTDFNDSCRISYDYDGRSGTNSISDIVIYGKSIIMATVVFVSGNKAPTLQLKTFADRRSVCDMYKLRDDIKRATAKYRMSLDKTLCFIHEYGSWQPDYAIKRRTFDDTFITQEARHKLFHGIDSFIERRDWFQEHNLPYHYGILLYGPPGTGKSTIIQAIANKYSFVPFIANKNIIESMRQLKDIPMEVDAAYTERPKLFVVEDIDSFSFASDRDIEVIQNDAINRSNGVSDVSAEDILMEVRERKRCRKDMSIFLNSMDGVRAAENIVYVFTTNNIGAIDPAVKRAGRLDLILEIGYVTNETFDDFLMYHFGKHLPANRNVKPSQIFADIQLEVMQGESFESIVDKYTDSEG